MWYWQVQEVVTGVVRAALVCAGGAASCWTGAEHALYRTCEWTPPWTHATMVRSGPLGTDMRVMHQSRAWGSG